MRTLFVLPCLLLLFTAAVSQDSLWNETTIDKNLSIDLPGEVDIIDTLGQRVFRSIDGNAAYVVTVFKDLKFNVDNAESLDEFLDGMAKGFTGKLQKNGMSIGKPQSIHIDSIEGRYLRCYSTNPDIQLREWVAHLFFVNGVAYTIVAVYTEVPTEQQRANLSQLIKSINFTASSSVVEKTFATKADAMGYKIGKLIGGALIPLAIVGLVLFFALRKRKPNSRT